MYIHSLLMKYLTNHSIIMYIIPSSLNYYLLLSDVFSDNIVDLNLYTYLSA